MAGNSIRINSGVLRIEVNDRGDTIALRKDMNFINNIMSFADGLGTLQSQYNAKLATIATDDADAKLDLVYQMHKELHDGLEGLFGAGTCRKVFGDGEVDVIPTMDAVAEFCEAISPFIMQIAQSLGGNIKNKHSYAVQKPVGYMGGAPEVAPSPHVTQFPQYTQQSVPQANSFSAFNNLRQQIDRGETGV